MTRTARMNSSGEEAYTKDIRLFEIIRLILRIKKNTGYNTYEERFYISTKQAHIEKRRKDNYDR